MKSPTNASVTRDKLKHLCYVLALCCRSCRKTDVINRSLLALFLLVRAQDPSIRSLVEMLKVFKYMDKHANLISA